MLPHPHSKLVRRVGDFLANTDIYTLSIAFGFMTASIALVHDKLEALRTLAEQEKTLEAVEARDADRIHSLEERVSELRREAAGLRQTPPINPR